MCAYEWLLRIAIIQKMASGWDMAVSFCIPESIDKAERIGKGPAKLPGSLNEHEPAPATQVTSDPLRVAALAQHRDLDDAQDGIAEDFVLVGKTD